MIYYNFSLKFNSGTYEEIWISLNGWNSTTAGTTETIFDNLIHGNNKEAIRIYRELISHSEEPVRLIALLSTQFRTVAEVLYLLKDGKSVFEISHILGIHEYRVKLASINGKYIGYKNCMRVLNDLYYLDYSIKSGETLDRFYAFERFLINFNTRI